MNRLNIEQRDGRVRRKFKEQDRSKIVQLWLQNMNYRQIAQQTKASLGTISAEIEKDRKAEPDLDSLRELNATLKKSGVALRDAMRGANLMAKMNELSLTLDQISGFVTGEKANEVARLEREKARLEGEIKKVEEKRFLVEKELEDLLSTRQRLLKVGVDKLEDLATFISEFETLGFSAKGVQELAQLKKELDEEGIRIGTLRQHFKSTRALRHEGQAIQREIESEKTKLKLLTTMRRETERNIRDLQSIQRVLDSRTVSFPCAFCGWVTVKEIRNFEVQPALTQGAPLVVACSRCGQPNYLDPIPALLNLALQVLS